MHIFFVGRVAFSKLATILFHQKADLDLPLIPIFNLCGRHYSIQLSPWIPVLLEKPTVAKLLKYFPTFIKRENSLLCSQELATCLHSQSDESSPPRPHPRSLSLSSDKVRGPV
jgi:hypothetical protein